MYERYVEIACLGREENFMEDKRNNKGVATELGREGYEASVMYRMRGRAGAYSPKGAAGNAFEIMANDKENIKNILKPDTVTKLTKSSTATQVDAITMKGNKIIERIQYKDTPSPSGMRKTLNQVSSGKYQQVQLRGTTETAEKFNAMAQKKGITKTMQSTGISSDTTKRVGGKFTNQMPTLNGIGNAAKTSAIGAVGVTAVVEVAKSVSNGDSVGECAGHVVSKSAESAIGAATSAVAAEAAFGAATTLLATTAAPVVVPVVVAGAAAITTGAVVGKITDGLFDDIGDSIGEAVDNIGNVAENVGSAISDIFWNVGCFFYDLL